MQNASWESHLDRWVCPLRACTNCLTSDHHYLATTPALFCTHTYSPLTMQLKPMSSAVLSNRSTDLAQGRLKLGYALCCVKATAWCVCLHRNNKEVAQLLERCNKVHQALCRADEDDEQQIPSAGDDTSAVRQSAVAAAVKAARSASTAAATLSKRSPSRYAHKRLAYDRLSSSRCPTN